jgi:hypothetical protein
MVCRVWRMITENGRTKNGSDSNRKTTTRTEIYVETHEVFIIRSLNQPGVEACGVELCVPTDDEPAAPHEQQE